MNQLHIATEDLQHISIRNWSRMGWEIAQSVKCSHCPRSQGGETQHNGRRDRQVPRASGWPSECCQREELKIRCETLSLKTQGNSNTEPLVLTSGLHPLALTQNYMEQETVTEIYRLRQPSSNIWAPILLKLTGQAAAKTAHPLGT